MAQEVDRVVLVGWLGRLVEGFVGRFVDVLGAPTDARGFDLFSSLLVHDPYLLDDVSQPQRLRSDIGFVANELPIVVVVSILDDQMHNPTDRDEGN